MFIYTYVHIKEITSGYPSGRRSMPGPLTGSALPPGRDPLSPFVPSPCPTNPETSKIETFRVLDGLWKCRVRFLEGLQVYFAQKTLQTTRRRALYTLHLQWPCPDDDNHGPSELAPRSYSQRFSEICILESKNG